MKRFLFIVLLLPIFSYAGTRLPENISNEIISFTLFSYDNLIADAYESEKPYINRLSFLLSEATNVTESVYYQILNSKELSSEPFPVKYMVLLNKKTLEKSGYYFVDE